ncbi:hypothetical protein KW786_00835 [Candidatus Parcubacteria bacterium]|nr:hypothetical protein [Candidatus Parcubacteria bacterium]
MKKPTIIIIVVLVVLVALAGLVLHFYKASIDSAGKSTNSNQDKNPSASAGFSILDDKDFNSSTKMESYKLGDAEFKIYPMDDSTNKGGYFEVYQQSKKVFSSEPNYGIGELVAFKLGENKYVIVDDYSGGAHCCDTDYLFRINKDSQVKLLKKFEMGNARLTKESLLFKNSKLYLVLMDDSFQYFHVPYALSYFFTQYYRLDGDNVVVANSDFKDDLIRTAEACEAKILKDPIKADDQGHYWLNDLICYVTNYTLAGKQADALKKFDGYFNHFYPSGTGKDEFGEVIKRDTLKKEIIDILKDERFK